MESLENMIQYVCDRCEAAVSNTSNLILIEFETNNSYNPHPVRKDLCPACIRQLVDFLKPLPKALPATK